MAPASLRPCSRPCAATNKRAAHKHKAVRAYRQAFPPGPRIPGDWAGFRQLLLIHFPAPSRCGRLLHLCSLFSALMTVSSFRGSSSNFDGCETACLFTTERASERAHFALTPRSAFKCVEDRPVAFQFLLTIQLCESNRILQSWCALQSANNYSQPCIFTSCELSDSGLANRYRLVPCVHHSA